MNASFEYKGHKVDIKMGFLHHYWVDGEYQGRQLYQESCETHAKDKIDRITHEDT